MWEMFLPRHKRITFLHRIVTGDEKGITYDNPTQHRAWVHPGEVGSSKPKQNNHSSKMMLCMWWDQMNVTYYEIMKPSNNIMGDRYRQQIVALDGAVKEKRTEYAGRHNKVILQHDKQFRKP